MSFDRPTDPAQTPPPPEDTAGTEPPSDVEPAAGYTPPPAEAAEPAPVEPAWPDETVEPAPPVEPVEPVQATQPVEPVAPAEPVQPAEPAEPVEPVQATQPGQPVPAAEPEPVPVAAPVQPTAGEVYASAAPVAAAPVAAAPVAVAPVERGPGPLYWARRVLSLLFAVLFVLLGVRIFLLLLVADASNDIVNFVYSVTEPFVAPFRGMFQFDEVVAGARTLDVAALAALIGWLLIYVLIMALLRFGDRVRS